METKAERHFLILGMPRSRTAWLANLMNRGGCLCHHELSNRGLGAEGMAVAMERGARVVGNSDPGAALIAEDLLKLLPEMRLVIVKRPVEEVVESFAEAVGQSPENLPLDKFLKGAQEALLRLEPKALVVDFKDLDKKSAVQKIWSHCLGEDAPFPDAQYEVLRNLNVQMEARLLCAALRGGILPGRIAPLDSREQALLDLVLEAHAQSAQRNNISTAAVVQCAAGNGTYTNSIAAGLLTLGGSHAPLEQSYELLSSEYAVEGAKLMMADGVRIPGWGNSFYRGEPDRLWSKVSAWIEVNRPDLHARISEVTAFLHSQGKEIYPNPSTYTAAAAIALGIPAKCAAYLFLQGRLLSWSQIFMKGAI